MQVWVKQAGLVWHHLRFPCDNLHASYSKHNSLRSSSLANWVISQTKNKFTKYLKEDLPMKYIYHECFIKMKSLWFLVAFLKMKDNPTIFGCKNFKIKVYSIFTSNGRTAWYLFAKDFFVYGWEKSCMVETTHHQEKTKMCSLGMLKMFFFLQNKFITFRVDQFSKSSVNIGLYFSLL